mgnify:CR=1 FL=1|jgi:hypothetical protein
MADLYGKVKYYAFKNGITEEQFRNFLLVDNGQGAFIDNWEFNIPKPTQEQLDALEKEADDYEQNLITTKENNKASAKQKLQDLGLTVDEIKEAFGI